MTDKPKRTSSTPRHPRPQPTSLRPLRESAPDSMSWADRLLILGLVVFVIAAGLAGNYVFWSAFVTWKCGC